METETERQIVQDDESVTMPAVPLSDNTSLSLIGKVSTGAHVNEISDESGKNSSNSGSDSSDSGSDSSDSGSDTEDPQSFNNSDSDSDTVEKTGGDDADSDPDGEEEESPGYVVVPISDDKKAKIRASKLGKNGFRVLQATDEQVRRAVEECDLEDALSVSDFTDSDSEDDPDDDIDGGLDCNPKDGDEEADDDEEVAVTSARAEERIPFDPKKVIPFEDTAESYRPSPTEKKVSKTCFVHCKGCPTLPMKGGIPSFDCIKRDPNLEKNSICSRRNFKHTSEAMMERWLKRHSLTWWDPNAEEDVKRCYNHKVGAGSYPKCKVATLNGRGASKCKYEVYRCTKKGCQRYYPRFGPIITNYTKESVVAKVEIYLRWAMRRDIQIDGRAICQKTILKHVRELEKILATWTAQHKVRLDRQNGEVIAEVEKKQNSGKKLTKIERDILGSRPDHAEVDETYIGGAKNGKGRIRRKVFALETLCLVNKYGQTVDFACCPLFKKNWANLKRLIVANIPPWSMPVVTDFWSGYVSAKTTYTHLRVNHSKMFLCPRVGACTNNLEGIHGLFKKALRRRGKVNGKGHARFFRVMANAGLTLATLKAGEFGGNVFVWLFQALASVIKSGHPILDDPEKERQQYIEKLGRMLGKQEKALLEEAEKGNGNPPPSATPGGEKRKAGRPPGSKNKKGTKASRAAAAATPTAAQITNTQLPATEEGGRTKEEKVALAEALLTLVEMGAVSGLNERALELLTERDFRATLPRADNTPIDELTPQQYSQRYAQARYAARREVAQGLGNSEVMARNKLTAAIVTARQLFSSYPDLAIGGVGQLVLQSDVVSGRGPFAGMKRNRSEGEEEEEGDDDGDDEENN